MRSDARSGAVVAPSAENSDESRVVNGQRRDPAAVRAYEKIKRLPPEVWPGDLDIRLDAARKQLR